MAFSQHRTCVAEPKQQRSRRAIRHHPLLLLQLLIIHSATAVRRNMVMLAADERAQLTALPEYIGVMHRRPSSSSRWALPRSSPLLLNNVSGSRQRARASRTFFLPILNVLATCHIIINRVQVQRHASSRE